MSTTGMRPLALTALYDEHVRRGAQMTEGDGWLLPRSYGDVAAERAAIEHAAGLLDIGAQEIRDVKSDELEAVLGAVLAGRPAPEVGVAGEGGEERERVLRLTGDQALVLVPPALPGGLLQSLTRAASGRRATQVTDLTGGLCGIRLVGPVSPAVLERLSSLDLAPDRCPDRAVAQGAVAGVHVVVLRRDARHVPGYDLYVSRDLGVYLWGAILEAGGPLGLIPVGHEAAEGWG